MTYRSYTLLGNARKPKPSFCLVCWPEEENKLSIIVIKKILSPSPADLLPETFCKVKGFEGHLCKVVAVGTELEMKMKMSEMEPSDDDEDDQPRKKKPRLEVKQGAQKKSKKWGKENKTPSRGKKGEKKRGNIILVGSLMTGRSALAECHLNRPPPPTTDRDNQANTLPPPSTHRDIQPNTLPPPSTDRDSQSNRPPPPSTHRDIQPNRPPPPSTHRDIQTNRSPPPTKADAHIYDSVSLDESFSSFSSIESSPPPLPPPLHQSELDDPLLLNLTVDENSKRLERLEAALAKLEASDANKAHRIEELEATVERLESLLNERVLPSCELGHTPAPPQHLPPPPVSPTPSQPQHAPSLDTATPPPGTLTVTPTLPRAPHHPQQAPTATLPVESTLPLSHPPQSPSGRLPSSSIIRSSLAPVDSVVQCYRDCIGKEGKMGTLAVALAREAFFGEEVMSQCTAKGYGGKPGLPIKELLQLKDELRKHFPNYWNNNVAYEEKWNKCLESISAACKRIRQKRSKQTIV